MQLFNKIKFVIGSVAKQSIFYCYWYAVSTLKLRFRHCERKRSNPQKTIKEWIASLALAMTAKRTTPKTKVVGVYIDCRVALLLAMTGSFMPEYSVNRE